MNPGIIDKDTGRELWTGPECADYIGVTTQPTNAPPTTWPPSWGKPGYGTPKKSNLGTPIVQAPQYQQKPYEVTKTPFHGHLGGRT